MKSKDLITDIYWRGTKLYIKIQTASDGSVPALSQDPDFYDFIFDEEEGAWYLNVCNVGSGEMLPRGEWIIDGYSADDKVYPMLENLDKVLRYDETFAYIVKISAMESGEIKVFTDFVKRNENPNDRGIKKNFLGSAAESLYLFFRSKSPFRARIILFFSETRNDMSDNFRALYDRMKDRGLDEEYKIEILLDRDVKDGSSNISKLQKLKKIAASDYIFIDDYCPIFTAIKPAEDVKLIQLWHAGFGYKAVGYNRFGIHGSPHPIRSCHRKYTHAICGNEALRDVYAGVFGISRDRIYPTGLPRLEKYRNPDTIEIIREKLYNNYGVLKGRRIILFAPTYRGSNQKEAFYHEDKLDPEALYEMCRETDSVFIMKFHPFMDEGMMITEDKKDRILDLSGENINDLMCISDILVTDYSSCFYDFLAIKEGAPILFYLYDENEYVALRGVCKPVSATCPGKVVRTPEELVEALRSGGLQVIRPKEYMIEMPDNGYSASDRIIDLIFGEKRPEIEKA